MNKYLITLCLMFFAGCKSYGQQQAHPMPKMGMKYVHFWKHTDSIEKVIFDSSGNYKKQWEKDGDRVYAAAAALDHSDDSLYRLRYHFSDYYYMWNYTTEHSQGWGENDITLDHQPTEHEIKDYVWNTMFKGEKVRKYECLEIIGIEAKSPEPNSLQNIPSEQKGMLNFQRSTYKLLQ